MNRSVHGDHYLGRRFAPDTRDENHPMRAKLGEKAAPIVHRKTWAFKGSPLDQGDTGTCTAFSFVHYLHAAPKETGFHRLPNPFDVYRKEVLVDEWDDNDNEATADSDLLQGGSSVRASLKVGQQLGFIGEYSWAWSVAVAAAWLAQHGPVLFGLSWGNSMFEVNRDGVLRYRPSAGIAGGHAILGYAVDLKRAFVGLLNSWEFDNASATRPAYRAWIPFEDLEKLIAMDGEVATAEQIRA